MRPSGKEKRAYRAAESRIRESIVMREVVPGHSYARRAEDLETLRRYHAEHGYPSAGYLARLWWLTGAGGEGR